MKLSLCTIGLRDRKADEAFRVMKECGYHYADLLAYSQTAHANRSMNSEQRQQLKETAAKYGVTICSLAGSVGNKIAAENAEDRAKAVDEIKAEIDLAVDLGATCVRVSAGGEVLEPILERAIPHFKEASKYAGSKGVKLVVENHGGSISVFPTQMTDLCRAVASPWFGVIYEPGNLLGMDIDYKTGFELMKEYIHHVHLKDGYAHYFRKDECFASQRLYCTPMGKGKLDVPWVMEQLKASGYAGYVSVEYESWHPEYHLPPTEQGLIGERNYLARWIMA